MDYTHTHTHADHTHTHHSHIQTHLHAHNICLHAAHIVTNIDTHSHHMHTLTGKHIHRMEKEGMIYLMMHSTHFIQTYGKEPDSKRGNLLLPPHGLLLSSSSKGSFICTIPDRKVHTTAFVTLVVEHWLQQAIVQLFHHKGSIQRPVTP